MDANEQVRPDNADVFIFDVLTFQPVCTRVHACACAQMYICTHMRARICKDVRTQRHARMHACMHARMHACTHARAHAHTQVCVLKGHLKTPLSASFVRHSHLLLTGGADATMRLWDVVSETAVATFLAIEAWEVSTLGMSVVVTDIWPLVLCGDMEGNLHVLRCHQMGSDVNSSDKPKRLDRHRLRSAPLAKERTKKKR